MTLTPTVSSGDATKDGLTRDDASTLWTPDDDDEVSSVTYDLDSSVDTIVEYIKVEQAENVEKVFVTIIQADETPVIYYTCFASFKLLNDIYIFFILAIHCTFLCIILIICPLSN